MEEEYWTLQSDEWWPVYEIAKRPVKNGPDYFRQYEIEPPSEEFIARYERVFEEFNEIQRELSEMQKNTQRFLKGGKHW